MPGVGWRVDTAVTNGSLVGEAEEPHAGSVLLAAQLPVRLNIFACLLGLPPIRFLLLYLAGSLSQALQQPTRGTFSVGTRRSALRATGPSVLALPKGRDALQTEAVPAGQKHRLREKVQADGAR